MKTKVKKFRFDSDIWFDVIVEGDDYESAKKRYNKLLRNKNHKI
jgi:hypothetical protein